MMMMMMMMLVPTTCRRDRNFFGNVQRVNPQILPFLVRDEEEAALWDPQQNCQNPTL